ncbi:MAG: ABC transporter ATP-binding protein [Rhodospirillales bacterium]|nr:ABC transporter ATP-binding protein [Rhodospirillales bacterium]
MTGADVVLSLAGTRRQRGSESDGFRLEVSHLALRRGECIAITGPSGSGKSTLLDLLGLVLAPDRSDGFMLNPQPGAAIDVARLWQRHDRNALAAIRARHIGYVLQTGGLLPFLPAIDNIRLSRDLLGLGDGDGLVERLTGALGIGRLLRKKPQALSIGERQRVAIARAIAHRPALLLADEPTAALDPGQAVGVMKLLLALVRELRITAVIVSHDWDLVSALGLRRVQAEPVTGEPLAVSRLTG